MPKFKLNDKTYNIPEDIVQEFLNDNPNAVALEKITPSQEEKPGVLAEVNVTPSTDLSLEIPSSGSQEKDTAIERTFGKNSLTDFFGDIYRAANKGLEQSSLVDPSINLYREGAEADDETILNFIKANEETNKNIMQSDEMREFNKIYEEEGGGWWGFVKGAALNPTVLTQELVSSIAMQIGALKSDEVATAATGGLVAGATGAGLASAGVLAVPGGVAGAMGGAMAALETGLTFSELLNKELGDNLTVENVRAFLQNEEKLSDLKNKALGRGLTIGAIELATMGIAKGVGGKIAKAGFKRAGLAAAGAIGGIEIAGGATGEIAGRFVAGQEMDAAEIGFEAFAGLGSAPVSILGQSKNISKGISRLKIDKELANTKYKDISDLFLNEEKTSNASINLTKIKNAADIIIEEINNKVKKGEITKEQSDKIKENFAITEQANNKLDVLEYQEKNKSEIIDLLKEKSNLEIKIQKVNEASLTKPESDRIKEIVTRLNELAEVNNTKKLKKSILFAEKAGKALGLETEVLSQEEIRKQYGNEAADSDGFIKNGKIIINEEVARQTEAVTVGSHEVLHGILNKALKGKDANKIVNQFKKIIGKQQLAKIEERLYAKENGKRLYSDEYIAANQDEYFTLFSDAIIKNQIKYNENIFTKLGDLIRPILRKLGFSKIKFDSGRDVYNFLKEYNKSVKEGELSKDILDLNIKADSDINAYSKTPQANKIQEIYNEKGKDGAFDIIQAYKPLTTKLTNNYRNVPGFDFELLQSEIEIGKRGLLDLINSYDPSKGTTLNTYIQGQLKNRSIEAANRILDTEFKLDVTEAKGVTDTTTEETIEASGQAEFADKIKSLRKEIGLSEELVSTVKDAVVKTFGTKLPNPQDSKFRLELQKRFRTELKKPIAKFVGKQADYESFLRDNFQSIYNKLPQSLINRRFKDFQEPVLDKNGKHVREKTAEGNKVYTKKKISKAEFIKYFLGSDVGRSTQGTRKTAIVEAVAEEIAFDATMEVLNDPAVIQKYQDIAGITGEVLPENFKSIIAKQVDRAENFKFSKSIASDAKAEYNLESQELGRILDKTSLDKLSNKYSLISDAIIYEADPNNIKFSLTTKADGKWEQNALNPLDESAKLYKFKVGEVDYEINTFSDRYAFNYDIFESTMGIQDEFVSNDPKSWAMAFADALDGSTDLTGVATQGLTNQFKVFGTVANATIDLIKKEKLNSITFSGKEKSRKRLYRSLSNKFAEELGWEAYDFEAQLASGAETVFIVYDPKAFPVEEQLENEKIKFSNSVDKSFMPANEIIELASLLNVRPTKKNVRNALTEIFDIIQKDPNAYENYEEIYDKWLKPYIEFKEKAQTLKWPAAEKRVEEVLLDLQSEGFNITNIKLNTDSQKVDIQFELKGKKFLIEVKKNEQARLSSIFLREDYDKNIFTSNPADKKYIEEIIKKDKTRNIIPDWIQKNYPNEIKYELKDGRRTPIVTTNALQAAFRVLKDKNIKYENTFKTNIGLVESIYKTKARKAENTEGVEVEAIIIDFGDLGSFYIGENKLNLPIPSLAQDINVDVRYYWKSYPRSDVNFNGKKQEAVSLFRIASPSLDLNAKEVLSKTKTLSLQNKYQAAQLLDKAKFSKSLNKEFNTILEQSSGIKATKKFSPVEARIAGKGKGKLKLFIPYSADDFVGLLYTTLADGKTGDQQMEWYKENLLRPFSRGIQQYEAAKQNALREWQILKKEAKKSVPGGLDKKNASGLTNQEAVRLYIWKQQGMEIPGTKGSAAFVNENLKTVRKNPELKAFAERLMALNPEGYPAPSENWDSGDITTDLVSYIDGVKRSEFLTEFKDNAAKIFSDSNKEKLRALYGDNFIEALDDMLHRMRTGTNRRFGASKIEKQFMDWTNNSVGAIMFFNARSAVLQTLSAVNFINFTDNNPINAALALANFPQYVKDFTTLFNSDFLKQRRTGLQTDVNADEIARAAKGAKNTARAMLSAILKFGFTPTQIADSFAIASGGATFYRNRINKYKKEGLSQQEAETKAFTDFQEIAEETQQSARPDRISLQQASSLGRLILAFGNTPMQYARLTKKASLDLINGRGDWKTNISKIMYYSVIQNIIFSALQQGLFALLFDDEDDDKEKSRLFRIGNSSLDTFLRGSGVYGAAAATAKNMILKVIEESEKSRPDYTKVAIESTAISPPINSKLRKLVSAGKTFTYKQSKEKVFTEGFSLENPAFLAGGQVVSALTNLPADRVVLKADHLKTAIEPETELWQSIALSLGWSEWDLNMIQNQTKKSKKFNPRDTNRNINRGLKRKKIKR